MKREKLIRMTAHSQTLGLLKGQLGFLQQYMDVILVAKDTGNLKQLALSEGVDYREIDIHREISPINDLKSLWKLIRLFMIERPDIVHANTPKGALLGLLAAKIVGVPKRIYNVNGLRFETTSGILRWLLITMERIACFCATKVIPQSNGVKAVIEKEHITTKPLRVILNGSGNGVDIDYFNPQIQTVRTMATEIKGNSIGVNFIFVGRIVGDKGVNELIEAFDRLSNEIPSVRLHLVGPREDKLDPISEKSAQIIVDNNRILEHGRQSDVRPFLAASDVFVLPSYREGFPNVVLEAASMGLPCIVSDVNGATDAVNDGVNGLIIPRRNSDALYNAMKQLSLNSELRSAMSEVARDMVKERFNRLDVWKATLEMYKSLRQ